MSIVHDSALHVDVREPQPAIFTLDLRGPRRAIEQLWAATADQPLQVEWPLPDAYARPGRLRLEKQELREVFASLPALGERGVFVEAVTPDSFQFDVDQVVSVEVPVQVNAGALRVEVERIEPERVRVWLRRGDLERLSEDQLLIGAQLEEDLGGEPRNRSLSLDDVPLEPRIADLKLLRVEPTTVNVRLRIVAETVRRRLEGVRVRLVVSPQVWQRYSIEIADANEWLLELEVEGDKTVVDSLRPQDVAALVSLTSEQAVPSAEFRFSDVVVELPEGVTLVGPSRLVHFRLVPREGATP